MPRSAANAPMSGAVAASDRLRTSPDRMLRAPKKRATAGTSDGQSAAVCVTDASVRVVYSNPRAQTPSVARGSVLSTLLGGGASGWALADVAYH